MGYAIHIEDGWANRDELLPLYLAHFAEMQARLVADGARPASWRPMAEQYRNAWDGGWLINYVARLDGDPVGVANVYVTNDRLTGEIVAVEENLFILPEHRNGLGRKLLQFIMADMPKRGAQRLLMDAATDLRAAKAWRRMGFTDYAVRMVHHFPENG